jgi:hypothetical protein
MTDVKLRDVKVARESADVDVSDLTTATRVGEPSWDETEPNTLVLPFDRTLTPVERVKVRRRLITADAAEEQRVTAYADARDSLRGVKGLQSPWNTVVAAVVALLDEQLARYGE